MLDAQKIRKDFPFLVNHPEIIYFDSGATSLKPQCVIDKETEYYTQYCANIKRGAHRSATKANDEYESARGKIKKFINASLDREIIFTMNNTHAMNTVVHGMGEGLLRPGDEVILSVLEHHSNLTPWLRLQKSKKIKVKFARPDANNVISKESVDSLMTENTKVISLQHVSNSTGAVNEIKNIAKLARSYDCFVVCDGAQSLGHFPVDVRDLDVDFYAAAGHKMFGPTGTGFLYMQEEHQRWMEPLMVGGETTDSAQENGVYKLNEPPEKYEAGTPNIAGCIALGAAVDYINKIGLNEIERHTNKKLVKTLYESLSSNNKVELYGPTDLARRSGLVSFNVKGTDMHEVGLLLDSMRKIAVRTGLHCASMMAQHYNIPGSVRASLHAYNTEEEIQIFLDTLNRIIATLA